VPVTSRTLVLASTSTYRRDLLDRLGVPFTVAAPPVDERAYDHRFEQLDDTAFAAELARAKANSLRTAWPDAWILAADQIAVLPGPLRLLLHKPGSARGAIEQLMQLAGRTHVLTTAVTLLDARTGVHLEAANTHRLSMRPFPVEEAEAYVHKYAPLDCVGAYRIEDAGIALFESIEGNDQTGIVGLPLMAVAGLLRQVGVLT
jgi:septum formation protein